jgi:hypothetical protein
MAETDDMGWASGPPTEIRGGAGPYEAAAVLALVQRLLEEEAAIRAIRPKPPIPSAWVRAGRSPLPTEPFPKVLPEPRTET